MNTIVNHIAILKIKATRRYLHIFPFKWKNTTPINHSK
jgi:hypothetical protein